MTNTMENRRTYRRRLAPYLAVEFDGVVYQVKDWSLSGFAIFELDRVGQRLHIGHEIEGRFSRSDEGSPSFPFCASVVDVRERENLAAFEFTELFAASYTALENLVTEVEAAMAANATEASPIALHG
ncbi:MAG: hypothetical protein AAGF58_15050 [Pseudomonadota bacterium]